jgi:hypothetical protein
LLLLAACRNAALSGLTHDIHTDVKQDDAIMEMHDDAEKFDPRTEEVFKVRATVNHSDCPRLTKVVSGQSER